jgi:hypothetical protein
MKKTLLILEILLIIAAYLIGTLGHTEIISNVINKETKYATRLFAKLKEGTTITSEQSGFSVMVKAVKHYCKESVKNINCDSLRIIRFENRHNFMNQPIFHAILSNSKQLDIGFTDFKISLESVSSRGNVFIATILLIIAVFIAITRYYLVSVHKLQISISSCPKFLIGHPEAFKNTGFPLNRLRE